jgi:predicted nucleotidyltransferase
MTKNVPKGVNAAGVIVELNPIHNGHIEHLRETLRITGRDSIIAVMSGNFVQRGEPAVYDKWRRTKMALLAGVDVVIELPLPYVLGGADYFARGAVGLLAATGVVDCLCFGSESGDIGTLRECGKILASEPSAYKKVLRAELDKGRSFAAARGAALEAVILGDVTARGFSQKLDLDFFALPNNGLGMEYCKALELLGNPMEVYTTHRKLGGLSASAIRKTMDKSEIICLDDFSDIFRYLLYTKVDLPLGEGLENRFRRYAGLYTKLSDILAAVKTKRYTLTRLQRMAMRIILGISPPLGGPPYIRILGFRKESSHIVGEMTRRARLPVLTTGMALDNPCEILAKELEAGDIYRLAYRKVLKNGYRHERGMGMVIL